MPRALESSTYSTKLLFVQIQPLPTVTYTLHTPFISMVHSCAKWWQIYIYILMIYMYMTKI